ncbi:MAG: hypothetical protein OXF88_20660 [Rhodobacteraceae bacterium]|nr:hypothetical protein [Paracoccaceae bacterium]MCY4139772.1 hypothetical protein [Paracoccaceae bacterium]
MHRVLIIILSSVLTGSVAANGDPLPVAETVPSAGPVDIRHRGFRELAVMLEKRVSSLDAILAIQGELLALALRDPHAAYAARPDFARCMLALPEIWCSRLHSTFQGESAQ